MKSSPARQTNRILALVLLALIVTQSEAFAQQPAQQSNANQGLSELPELTLGVPVSQTIKTEAQSFRISMTASYFVSVIVEPQGIDLALKVFGPDGQQLAEVNQAESGDPERIAAIAEADGPYRVEVRCPSKNAEAGRYVVKISELRLATDQDRSLVTAQTAHAEADRARLEKPAKRQEAIKKYEDAILSYRAVGERQGEARAQLQMGWLYNLLGQRLKGLDHLEEARSLNKTIGNRKEEASALMHIVYVSSWLPEKKEKELEYLKEALRLSQSVDDAEGEAWALETMSRAYSGRGETQKAFESLNLALARSRAAHNREMEVRLLFMIGGSYNGIGDTNTALEYFNEALPIFKQLGDTYMEALTLTNIGWAYSAMREWQKALDYHLLALPLHKAQDDRRLTEAISLTSIGRAYLSLEKYQEALDYLNQALPIHKSIDNRANETATLGDLGDVYQSMGQYEKGLDYLKQALKIAEEMSYYREQASLLWRIAKAERGRGELIEARRHIEASLEIVESLRARFVNRESRTSFTASNRGYYDFYLDLLMRLNQNSPANGHDAEALQASERAHARGLLDVLNEGLAGIRKGVDSRLLERERAIQRKINDEELKRVRAKNKSNQDEVQAIEKGLRDLLQDYSYLQAEIRTSSPRYAALTQPEALTLTGIQQQVLDDKTMLLEYALGEERSYLWVVTQSELKSFVLPKRSLIEATARRVYELLPVSHKTEASRAAELALVELARMILSPAADLLTKERVVIVADGALEYIPFGALPVVSEQGSAPTTSTRAFDSYEPLVVRHEVVNLPSASVLAVLRRDRPKREYTSELAVLADAVFQSDDARLKQGNSSSAHISTAGGVDDQLRKSNDLLRSAGEVGTLRFSRLPFSRREADAIVARVGEVRSLKALDFAASRETVLDPKLSQYRIVHFATHGLLNSQHPSLSGLVLSLFDNHGRPVDGFLRAHEIYNLNLNAELVVLSACRTALGKEIRGEGLIGLTRGFMYAGTPSVVASLWDVRDEATSELMSRFYERMFKDRMRPAAALRAAQVSMWKEKRWSKPSYWAGFILQGEWK